MEDRITKNFKKSEFDCSSGAEMPDDVFSNVIILAKQLQVLRDYLKSPIRINSGYRSKEYNKKIGGVSNSQHINGKAADIVVSNYNTKEVLNAIELLIKRGDMLQGGVGFYDSFIHYDIRKTKVRWKN